MSFSTLKKLTNALSDKIFLLFYRLIIRFMFDGIHRLSSKVFFLTYEKTFELYPENALHQNIDKSNHVRKLLTSETLEVDLSNENDDIKNLYSNAINDENIRSSIIKRLLMINFFYNYTRSSVEDSLLAEMALNKAITLDENSKPLVSEDFISIYIETKKELKEIQKRIRVLSQNKIQKNKEIEPFKITQEHFLFFISLFSILFVSSGFIYNKVFFSYFNISLSDFFLITDYLSSSIEKVVSAFLFTIIGLYFTFMGFDHANSEVSRANQFADVPKNTDMLYVSSVLFLTLLLLISAHSNSEFYAYILIILVYVLLIEIFPRFPIWSYLENRNQIQLIFFIIITYFFYLGIGITQDIKSMDSNFSGGYKIFFTEEYRQFDSFEFISSNSNYTFLWDSFNASIIIVPNNAIISYESSN